MLSLSGVGMTRRDRTWWRLSWKGLGALRASPRTQMKSHCAASSKQELWQTKWLWQWQWHWHRGLEEAKNECSVLSIVRIVAAILHYEGWWWRDMLDFWFSLPLFFFVSWSKVIKISYHGSYFFDYFALFGLLLSLKHVPGLCDTYMLWYSSNARWR